MSDRFQERCRRIARPAAHNAPPLGTDLLSGMSSSSAGDARADHHVGRGRAATGVAADIAERAFAAAGRVRKCRAGGRALAVVLVAAAALEALAASLAAPIAARAAALGARAATAAGLQAGGRAVGGDPISWAAEVVEVVADFPLAALVVAATLPRREAYPAAQPLVEAAHALAADAAAGAALAVAAAARPGARRAAAARAVDRADPGAAEAAEFARLAAARATVSARRHARPSDQGGQGRAGHGAECRAARSGPRGQCPGPRVEAASVHRSFQAAR
jgi:hypothetical protein